MAHPSRTGCPIIDVAKAFLERAIRAAAIADDTQVAVVAFGTTAVTILGLGSVAAPLATEAAIAAIRNLHATGIEAGNNDNLGTKVSAGLSLAHDLFAKVEAASSRHIVVTDGYGSEKHPDLIASLCKDSSDSARSCAGAVWRAGQLWRGRDVHMHTVYASECHGDLGYMLNPDSVTNIDAGGDNGSGLLNALSLGYDVGTAVVTIGCCYNVECTERRIVTAARVYDFTVEAYVLDRVTVQIFRRGDEVPYVTASVMADAVCEPPPAPTQK